MKRNFNEDYILARNIKNNWDGRLAIYGENVLHLIDALPWVFSPYVGKGLSTGIIADVLEVPKQNVQRMIRQRKTKLDGMGVAQLGRLNSDLRKLLSMDNPRGGANNGQKRAMKRALLVTKIKQDLHNALAEMHEHGHFQIQTPTTVHLVDALPHVFVPYIDRGLNFSILADALEVDRNNMHMALSARKKRLDSLTDAQRKMINPDLAEIVSLSLPRGGWRRANTYAPDRAAMVEAIKTDIVKAVTKLTKKTK